MLFTNYKNYLSSQEKEILHFKEDVIPNVIKKVFVMNVIFVFFSAIFPKILPILFLFLFIYIILSLIMYIKYLSVNYIITNKGIYKISGILSTTVKYIPFLKITDTTLTINIFQSIFKVATLNVSTAGGTNDPKIPYEMKIKNILNFKEISDLIKNNLLYNK